MKKMIWIALVAVFIGVGAANAQSKKFSFGPKIGLNISTITDSHAESWRTGANVGMFAEYHKNDFIGFQGELMFSMMGANYGNSNKIRLNYISIPLLVKLYIWDNFSLDLGPQIGFKVYDKIKMVDSEFSNSDMFHPVELSFVVGIGYEFDMGLTAAFRYIPGLTNALNSDYTDHNSKNQLFQLSLGWKF